jgi:hypothetical protein
MPKSHALRKKEEHNLRLLGTRLILALGDAVIQCRAAALELGLPDAAGVQEGFNHNPSGRSRFPNLNRPKKAGRSDALC